SPLAYATVCTPLLSGLLYGWRGAGVLTGLQLAVLVTVHRTWEHHPGAGVSTLLIAGFCVAAGIIGVTLRNLMFRFGTATQALSEATSRLAVAEAVESERARLARELHDSVAKTLHGLALAADALAASADLRTELAARTADFASRTGLPARLVHTGGTPPPLPPETTHHLLAITSEALENIHRHATATAAEVSLRVTPDTLHLTIVDDGVGLPPALTLEEAQESGHFGLLGMAERADRAFDRAEEGDGAGFQGHLGGGGGRVAEAVLHDLGGEGQQGVTRGHRGRRGRPGGGVVPQGLHRDHKE
ncbi:histidine kinase, partial [Streptomyces scabiei]|uniref:sensor histidine kinase n=1 Tax=Streptomyces scabiei TaxID=1930 RepID=UPI0029BBCF02